MNKEMFERAEERDLHVGDEIIWESKHWDYKTGRPIESEYFRTVVGEHRTVSGMMFHLVPEPDIDFPVIPRWSAGYVYAGNGHDHTMWRRKEKS